MFYYKVSLEKRKAVFIETRKDSEKCNFKAPGKVVYCISAAGRSLELWHVTRLFGQTDFGQGQPVFDSNRVCRMRSLQYRRLGVWCKPFYSILNFVIIMEGSHI